MCWQGLEVENLFRDGAHSFLSRELFTGLALPGSPTSKSWGTTEAPHPHLWNFYQPGYAPCLCCSELSAERGWLNSLLLAISNPGSSQRVGGRKRNTARKEISGSGDFISTRYKSQQCATAFYLWTFLFRRWRQQLGNWWNEQGPWCGLFLKSHHKWIRIKWGPAHG